MAPGHKTGGRKKGTPNKVPSDIRNAFKAIYEGRLVDLDRWILETGNGYEAEHVGADGLVTTYTEKNPGKAADILTRMAEHFVPKLQRIEKTIADSTDEELLAEVQRRKAEAAKGTES